MNDYELMKLSEKEEEAVNLYDFTPDQIEALSKMKMEALRNYNESNYLFPLYKDNEEAPKDYLDQIFNLYLLELNNNKELYEG